MRVRAHWLTALLWAGIAAWAVVAGASFELAGFEDRVVSSATLHGVDVAARTRLYAAALGTFLCAAIAAVFILAGLARIVGDDALSDLEDASLGGLVVLLMAGLTSVEGDAVKLVAWLEMAYLACAALDARVFGRRVHPRPGSAFLILCASAYALLCATPWRTSAPVVSLLAVALHVLLQVVARGGNTARVDRLLAGLAPLSLVPLALVARDEFTLIANQRGFAFIDSTTSGVIVALLLVSLAAVRVLRADVRGRIDVARLLARTSLPCLLLGLSTLTFWAAVRTPPNEMLEAGNAGLSIQQWFEYGRLPFFETFDVHGLSDSLMGFVYACVNGWNGTTWQHWDFVPFVLAMLGVYALLARVLGSAPLGFLVVVVSPFVRELFPSAFGIAIAFAFVALACIQARRTSTFAWTAIALVAVWLWRMDLGFAVSLATATVFGLRAFGVRGLDRDEPFPWRRALLGFGLCGAALALVTAVIAAWRGVDLVARAKELSHVVASDQAFGVARLAERIDEVVSFRLFVMPALLVATAALLFTQHRTTTTETDKRTTWSIYALVYLLAFSLVLATRGLVRHTFVENVGAYVTGFGFAVVALSPCVLLDAGRRRIAFGGFVALHALLPLAFAVGQNDGAQSDALRSNVLARASHRLRSWTPMDPAGTAFARSPVSAEFRARHIEPMQALASEYLAPCETFLDMSASPMLYVYAGRRSPHWLNHLITVQGDCLQQRFLFELERAAAPLVVMNQKPELGPVEGMQTILDIDGVPLALWHARIFDALHEKCEPFRMAGRFEVWARTDWGPTSSASTDGEMLGTIAIGGADTGQSFEARAGESLALIAECRAGTAGSLHVGAQIALGGFEDSVARDIAFSKADSVRCIPLTGEGAGFWLSHVSAMLSGGLEITRLTVRRVRDPAMAEAAARAAVAVDSELGSTAALWGRHDRAARASIASLHASRTSPDEARSRPVAIQDGTRLRFPFTSPSRTQRSVLVVCELACDAPNRAQALVRYGVGELVSGSFRFDVVPGQDPATYVFRPGFQANWHRRPNAWLEIEAQGASLRVHSLDLAREP